MWRKPNVSNSRVKVNLMLSSEDLRFFCALARQPSLAATARMLNVTPSSVTQRLQGIEEKLALKLLNREGRTITLTDEGQLLAERAQLILAELDELQASLHERKNTLVGRLRILAPLGFGNEYVTMGDLRHHACIALRENAEDVTMWRLRAPGQDSPAAIRIRPDLASNDGRVVKQWALRGHGIMLRSEWNVARELRSGALVCILPDHAAPAADIVALLGSEQRQRSARTMRFLELLKQSLTPAPWG